VSQWLNQDQLFYRPKKPLLIFPLTTPMHEQTQLIVIRSVQTHDSMLLCQTNAAGRNVGKDGSYVVTVQFRREAGGLEGSAVDDGNTLIGQ
jgi:hypothetical protein